MDSGGKRGASRVSPVVVDPKADPRSQNFLPDLSESSICAINQISHVRRRPKGTILFFEGDTASGVYVLFEGRERSGSEYRGKNVDFEGCAAGCLHGLIEFLLTTACNEDIGTFVDEKFSVANPIPSVPPVMAAVLPSSLLGIVFLH